MHNISLILNKLLGFVIKLLSVFSYTEAENIQRKKITWNLMIQSFQSILSKVKDAANILNVSF